MPKAIPAHVSGRMRVSHKVKQISVAATANLEVQEKLKHRNLERCHCSVCFQELIRLQKLRINYGTFVLL